MTDEQFTAIMPIISADLIRMIVKKQNVSEREAIHSLYNSRLYSLLEREDTKIWQYSTEMLYTLLLEE